MDDDPQPNLNFKENVYCRWFIAEGTKFFYNSGKVKRLIDLLRPDVHNDIISIKDPKPGLISLFSPIYDSSDEEPREDNEKTQNNIKINK